MKPYSLIGKDYEFNRPTPSVLAVVEAIANESELFNSILDLPKIFSGEKERFVKLSEDWKRFCDVVFKGGFKDEITLENLIYPDEVRGAAEDFFTLPSEKTMKALKERADALAKTTKSS